MNTPIYDFITQYRQSGTARLHVPGHKGVPILGPEPFDLTEIKGADSLYEADGIIAQSEANATALFGSGATFYSTEGSSLCIRAMLTLLLKFCPPEASRTILVARNAHKTFIYTAALLGLEVRWLYPKSTTSLVSCLISPSALEQALRHMDKPPMAVYVTSPDYLGSMQDLAGLAEVCHRYGTRLAVDNAHGAYLHFLPHPVHPMDLGADICCDSAHKTLPVLTGGAYLHLSKACPPAMLHAARSALALFGSTSPSYLTLASLDLCNRYLATDFTREMREGLTRIGNTKQALRKQGWMVLPSDPLRISLRTDGPAAAEKLRAGGVEPEFVDPEFVVMMATQFNSQEDLDAIPKALGSCEDSLSLSGVKPIIPRSVLSLPQVLSSRPTTLPIEDAVGLVCADPVIHCPPGVPIVMPGEIIEAGHLHAFRLYGITHVDVIL